MEAVGVAGVGGAVVRVVVAAAAVVEADGLREVHDPGGVDAPVGEVQRGAGAVDAEAVLANGDRDLHDRDVDRAVPDATGRAGRGGRAGDSQGCTHADHEQDRGQQDADAPADGTEEAGLHRVVLSGRLSWMFWYYRLRAEVRCAVPV